MSTRSVVAPFVLAILCAASSTGAQTEPAATQPQPLDNPGNPEKAPEPTDPPIAPTPTPGTTPAPGAPTDPSTNEADKRIGVGIDAFLLVPVGSFGDQTGLLFGPVTRFGYRIVSLIELSVRAGYLFAAKKDRGNGVKSKLDLLPVWLEARSFILDPFAGPYVTLAVGMNMYLPTVTPAIPGAEGDRVTELRRRFGANVGAGYVLSASLPVDLRLQLWMPNLAGRDDKLKEKTDIGVSLSVGYTLQF